MRKHFFLFCALSVGVLLTTSACNQGGKTASPVTGSISAGNPVPVNGAKVAYVNMDTLEARCELLKANRDEFKHRQEQMESELQQSYQQMQSDAQEVQKKAEANTLTQTEYENAQKRLSQQQQSLKSREQALSEQLAKAQDDFNKDLKNRLDMFLEEYNKSHNYDYILSYAYAGSPLLYVNKQYDITKDVVDGMNEQAKKDADKKK
jgi:outer membrane protein